MHFFVGADIRSAWLGFADLSGVNFWSAKIDSDTKFQDASLRGASFFDVDLSETDIQFHQYNKAFGDKSVKLPKSSFDGSKEWPTHWPTADLDMQDFQTEWRKWQANPETYTPPPAP